MLPHVLPVVALSVPFFYLNIAMVYFICRRRRKDPALRSGFFTIYAAICVADCALMAINVIFAVIPLAGGFPEFYRQCDACATIMYDVAEYLHVFQLLGHTAIALNRFTCFGVDAAHNFLWKGRGLGWIAELSDCFLYSALTLVDFALVIAAVVRIRRYGKAGQAPAHRRMQIKLLAYTVYITCIQQLRALFFLSMAFADYGFLGWPTRIAFLTFHPVIELYCFSGTVFLLVVSPHVRREFVKFYCKFSATE
ncbi:hypothetical protein AAVH_10333 [Aphelenchoides avenae]|nr:hypothetical protein AAVH_10333 [Aphelenchus avenae]